MFRPAEMKQEAVFLRVEISLYVQHDGTDEQGLFVGFLLLYEIFQFFRVGYMEKRSGPDILEQPVVYVVETVFLSFSRRGICLLYTSPSPRDA